MSDKKKSKTISSKVGRPASSKKSDISSTKKSTSKKQPSSTRPTASSSSSSTSRKVGSRPTVSSQISSSGKATAKAPIQADTSAPTASSLEEQRELKLANLNNRWASVAGLVALTALFDRLNSVTDTVSDLDQKIASVRSQGYPYDNNWEERAVALQERWPRLHTESSHLLETEGSILRRSSRDVEGLLDRARRDYNLIDTVDSRLSALEHQANNIEQRAYGIFGSMEEEANALVYEVEKVRKMLDELGKATFSLYPDEHGVATSKVTWVSDREEPEGQLFLTDRRLIFERREKIATKKVLFITTEKKLVQEVMWESPIGAVEEVEAEDKGGFIGIGGKELLTLRFSERTRELPSDVTLEIKDSTNEEWSALIRKVRSGQIDAERVGAPAPEEAATAAEAPDQAPKVIPTKCPGCGAQLPPVYKGMTQVICDYCGTVVPLE